MHRILIFQNLDGEIINKMAIDTGKIFGDISIGEYCATQHAGGTMGTKAPYYYDIVAIHSHKETIEDFAELVPDNAEAVVKYQHNFFGAGSETSISFQHHQMGIALIPKTKPQNSTTS